MITKFNCRVNENDFLEIVSEDDLLYLEVKQGDEMSLVVLDKDGVEDLISLLELLKSKLD
jgi:hypothetical protein